MIKLNNERFETSLSTVPHISSNLEFFSLRNVYFENAYEWKRKQDSDDNRRQGKQWILTNTHAHAGREAIARCRRDHKRWNMRSNAYCCFEYSLIGSRPTMFVYVFLGVTFVRTTVFSTPCLLEKFNMAVVSTMNDRNTARHSPMMAFVNNSTMTNRMKPIFNWWCGKTWIHNFFLNNLKFNWNLQLPISAMQPVPPFNSDDRRSHLKI